VAEEVANSVIEHKFNGYYLDANAISPQRAIKIGQMMETAGIHSWTVASSADLHGSQKRRGYTYLENMQK
jgi:hypothetical protein